MLSISIGPASLSIDHLLLLGALAVALTVGWLIGRRRNTPVAGTLADLFLLAMISARIGFVVRYFDEYQNNWLGIINIRDGGFDLFSGLLAALAFTGYRMWRQPATRLALGSAVAIGLISWGATFALLALLYPPLRDLPDIALTDLSGRPVSLAELADNRPTVINLWETWCPPCIREMPVLEHAQQRYSHINIVFVNQGESPATIRQFLIEKNLSLSHVLSDRQSHFGQAVGSRGLPTTLFYNAAGQLVDSHMGELSRASLAHSLQLLAGGRIVISRKFLP